MIKLLILNGISINEEILKNENFTLKLFSVSSYKNESNKKISAIIMNTITAYKVKQLEEEYKKEREKK